MKIIAGLLIVVGVAGIGMGAMMYGDIGIAAIVGGLVGILSGSGFWLTAKSTQQIRPNLATEGS